MAKKKSNVTILACKQCDHKKVCKHKDELKKQLGIYKKELEATKDSNLTLAKIECKYFSPKSLGLDFDDDNTDLFGNSF